MAQNKTKLEIRKARIFSNAFKKQKVKELIQKQISIAELCRLYGISRTSVYKWLYKYSPHYQQKTKLVVEMESESQKTKLLLHRVSELEQIIGQKQLELDYLNKLLELGSQELGFDVKKKFSALLSNGLEGIKHDTAI